MDNEIKEQVDIINQKIKELNSLYHIAAGKSGIADGEVCIWSTLLNAEENYSQQDLCDLLSLSKQTVNSLISSLCKKGYVVLEHVTGSRNRKIIRLTEEGWSYGQNRVMWIFKAEQRAMAESDPIEIRACISMLEKYISHLKKEFTGK